MPPIKPTEQQIAQAQERLDLATKARETAQETAKLQSEITEATVEEIAAKIRLAELNGESVKLLEKELDTKTKSLDATKRLEDQTKNLIKKTTLIGTEWKEGILGSILASDDAIGIMGQTLKDTITPANILGSAMMAVKEATIGAAISFDAAQSSLAGLTGTGRAYAENVIDIANANGQFGAGIAESAQAMGNLHTSMAAFSRLAPSAKNSLAGLAVQMENFGISGAETGEIMEDLTAGFGMSVEESTEMFKKTVATLNEIGMTPQQISQGFQQAMPQLAHWGKESVSIFKKVAAASKGLSVEMGTLIGFAQQFDTFEGAASAVGKLNAMMGGDALNTYEMMNATEAERIEMLLESIDLNGVVWDDMNRFEKRAMANAAGITDMAEANKMFEGGLGAYRSAQSDLEGVAGSTEAMAERSAAAVDIMQKLKVAVEKFAIATKPIIETIHSVLDAFLSLDGVTQKWISKLVLGLGSIVAISKVIGSFTAIASMFGGAGAAAAGAGAVAAGGGILASLTAAAPLLLGIAAVGTAIWGISKLASSPKKTSGGFSGGGNRGGGSSGSYTVVLEVDGKKLADVLVPYGNKRYDLRVKEAVKGR